MRRGIRWPFLLSASGRSSEGRPDPVFEQSGSTRFSRDPEFTANLKHVVGLYL